MQMFDLTKEYVKTTPIMLDLIIKTINQIPWDRILEASLRISLIVLVVWLVSRAIRFAMNRAESRVVAKSNLLGGSPVEAQKRVETLFRLLKRAILSALWVVGGLVILGETGLEIGPLLASAGIAGLAIGFGAQNLVRDIISGFFMLLENQVRVGDVVVINGTGGLVESVNFRTVSIRDLTGTVHVFPNGTINTLANKTYQWSAYVFEIGIAYKEDVDRVSSVIRGVGEQLRKDPDFESRILEEIEIFGLDSFGDSSVVIKGRIKTQPSEQWNVGREFLRRIKRTFDDEGIEIPFPYRTLVVGSTSEPLKIEWQKQPEGSP